MIRTDGDNHLGGEDFDLKIMEWIKNQQKAGDLPCLGELFVVIDARDGLGSVNGMVLGCVTAISTLRTRK